MKRIWRVSKAKGGFKLNVIARNGKSVATFGEIQENKMQAVRMAESLCKSKAMRDILECVVLANRALVGGNVNNAQGWLLGAARLIDKNLDTVEGPE